MKKVLLSLLMVAFLMPFAMQAQNYVPRTIITNDTAVCDSINVDGVNYTADTAFLQIAGDTMYVWNITINHSYNISESITANCSYKLGDSTYYTAGTYSSTLTTAAGCDSVVSVTLTFTGNDTVSFNDTVCEYYKWNGEKIYTNGDHTQIDTVHGCTTLGHFNLTIITPYEVDSNAICTIKDSLRCGKYKYGKITYYETTTVYDTTFYRTVDRCYDSVFALYLEIFPKYLGHDTIESCGITTFAGETYYQSVSNKTVKLGLTTHKCDSSTVLNLTILPEPIINSIDGNYQIAPGETSELAANVTMSPADPANSPLTYLWEYKGTTSSAQNITVPNVTENTDVRLTVSHPNGCSDSRAITIIPYDASGIDAAIAASINLYPNPTTQWINISCEEAIREVVIFNAIGQQVSVERNLGNKGTINLSGLAKGNYSMRIVLENGNSATRKFIVSK